MNSPVRAAGKIEEGALRPSLSMNNADYFNVFSQSGPFTPTGGMI